MEPPRSSPPHPSLELQRPSRSAAVESVPRVVVDTDYLTAHLPERLSQPAELDAVAWEQALLYAGLLPLLQADIPAGGELAERLGALREGLANLRLAEGPAPLLARPAGPRPGTGDRVIGGLAVLSLLMVGLDLRGVAAIGLVGLLGILAARNVQQVDPGPAPRGANREARLAMTRAVRGFLRHTWVEAVGPGLLESAPAATVLRRRMARLDETMRRARARLDGLGKLAVEVRAANAALGGGDDDPETRRIAAQKETLRQQLHRAEEMRGRFVEQLDACERSLDRLRAVARRKLLSNRVSDAVAGDLAEAGLAAAEVDIMDLDARADALGREVADAELRLSASLETVATLG